jgi:hypothetical protein
MALRIGDSNLRFALLDVGNVRRVPKEVRTGREEGGAPHEPRPDRPDPPDVRVPAIEGDFNVNDAAVSVHTRVAHADPPFPPEERPVEGLPPPDRPDPEPPAPDPSWLSPDRGLARPGGQPLGEYLAGLLPEPNKRPHWVEPPTEGHERQLDIKR